MMKLFSRCLTVLALAALLSGQAQGGQAQGGPAYSVLWVEKMHCAGCAKRIGGKLQEVPGVAKIQYDVEKKLLWVHPQPGKQLSPRALWEAVEKGKDRPIRLHGPNGVFTTKPQS